jgi:predicted DNA-binding transcriptional regulator AlpA
VTDTELWTDRDLSKFLKLSEGAIRMRRAAARRAGTAPNLPPAIRLGHSVRYSPSLVAQWLSRQVDGDQLSCV